MVNKFISEVTNEDCMEGMARYPDKYFDLAIVDPPYGIGAGVDNRKAIETKSGNNLKRLSRKGGMEWDRNTPNQTYFNELKRVSKNQIIWGGNYFKLGPCRCFIAWDKVQPWENFSQVEFAWTSFDKPAKLFKYDNRTGDKIHPTQKPVNLYNWILKNFSKPGDKIIDTHLGSGSIAIACHYFGLHLTACEIDLFYFQDAVERIKDETIQTKLFQYESAPL